MTSQKGLLLFSCVYLVLTLVLLGLTSVGAANTYHPTSNTTQLLCYSGSNLYQMTTVNCRNKDTSYTGSWYCVHVEICEQYISASRTCSIVKGCATAEQCTSSSSSIMDKTAIQSTSGIYPAGLTITATCCAPLEENNDDGVSIDYYSICNSGSRGGSSKVSIFVTAAIALVLSIMYTLPLL